MIFTTSGKPEVCCPDLIMVRIFIAGIGLELFRTGVFKVCEALMAVAACGMMCNLVHQQTRTADKKPKVLSVENIMVRLAACALCFILYHGLTVANTMKMTAGLIICGIVFGLVLLAQTHEQPEEPIDSELRAVPQKPTLFSLKNTIGRLLLCGLGAMICRSFGTAALKGLLGTGACLVAFSFFARENGKPRVLSWETTLARLVSCGVGFTLYKGGLSPVVLKAVVAVLITGILCGIVFLLDQGTEKEESDAAEEDSAKAKPTLISLKNTLARLLASAVGLMLFHKGLCSTAVKGVVGTGACLFATTLGNEKAKPKVLAWERILMRLLICGVGFALCKGFGMLVLKAGVGLTICGIAYGLLLLDKEEETKAGDSAPTKAKAAPTVISLKNTLARLLACGAGAALCKALTLKGVGGLAAFGYAQSLITGTSASKPKVLAVENILARLALCGLGFALYQGLGAMVMKVVVGLAICGIGYGLVLLREAGKESTESQEPEAAARKPRVVSLRNTLLRLLACAVCFALYKALGLALLKALMGLTVCGVAYSSAQGNRAPSKPCIFSLKNTLLRLLACAVVFLLYQGVGTAVLAAIEVPNEMLYLVVVLVLCASSGMCHELQRAGIALEEVEQKKK